MVTKKIWGNEYKVSCYFATFLRQNMEFCGTNILFWSLFWPCTLPLKWVRWRKKPYQFSSKIAWDRAFLSSCAHGTRQTLFLTTPLILTIINLRPWHLEQWNQWHSSSIILYFYPKFFFRIWRPHFLLVDSPRLPLCIQPFFSTDFRQTAFLILPKPWVFCLSFEFFL